FPDESAHVARGKILRFDVNRMTRGVHHVLGKGGNLGYSWRLPPSRNRARYGNCCFDKIGCEIIGPKIRSVACRTQNLHRRNTAARNTKMRTSNSGRASTRERRKSPSALQFS